MDRLFFWYRISLLLFQLACFGTGNSRFDGSFARINLFFWLRISRLLFPFARFGSGNSGFDGGFARIDLLFWFGISLLLFQLAAAVAFDGGFARMASARICSVLLAPQLCADRLLLFQLQLVLWRGQ